jgi:DNA-binding protein HU-beta
MGKPMSKSQVAVHLASKFEPKKKTAVAILEEMAHLSYREARYSFTMLGIGKLVLVAREARIGRNSATGEQIQIPAKTVVKFRVAQAAKEAVLGMKK